MEGKKISFGFSKTRRAPDTRLAAPVQTTPEEEQRDYIDCLEEKAIKIVGGEVIEEKKPLVIPMKPNTLVTSAERLQQIAAEVESSVDQSEAPAKDPEPAKVENETLEQQVERELMEDARNVKKVDPLVMAIQMEKLPPLEGQKESTLDDYESVPIADFGLAMLRGMGWTPGKESKYSHPSLRPKGLGLGADKLVKQGAVRGGGGVDEEEIKLRKGCHVRVTAGKHSGAYGKGAVLHGDPLITSACDYRLMELKARLRKLLSILTHPFEFPSSGSKLAEETSITITPASSAPPDPGGSQPTVPAPPPSDPRDLFSDFMKNIAAEALEKF